MAPKPSRKYNLRWPILAIAVLIACTLLGWMSYYAYLDWSDERALNDYLSQLEKREPDWRERVYGRPLTQEAIDAGNKMRELNKLTWSDAEAWTIYRESYFAGMVQDPLRSAARFTPEQAEYLKWVVAKYQQMLDQAQILDSDAVLPYFIDVELSYEKMQQQAFGLLGDTYTNHEIIELQFFDALQRNDPNQAVTSLVRLIKERRRKNWPGMTSQVNVHPGYVERLLNLTEPDDASLQKLEAALAQYIEESPQQFLLNGANLRMLGKRIVELSDANLTYNELDRGTFDWVIDRDSILRQAWLRPAFTWLANMKIKHMFRRKSQLTLKLYQLADRVEELARLPDDQRWPAWKQYCQQHNLGYKADDVMKRKPPTSVLIPDGLHSLVYVHTYLVTSVIEKDAMHRAALAAVISERFRRKHGRFPTSWSQLVPEFVSRPILDPFTGHPLKLRTAEESIYIYSLGPDEADHEGSQRNTGHHWFMGYAFPRSFKGNLGLKINIPAQRRQPAIEMKDDAKEVLGKWKEYEAKKKAN